jgi:predicted nucleotidyltransferase
VKALTREDIIRAFEMLSAELPAAAAPHELVIMGGAALVLRFQARDSTRDVDAVSSDKVMREAAARVGARLGLPEDWLNDGAKGYVHGLALGDVVFATDTLRVRALAVPQLLAMKLSAWRDDLDIADARLLLSKLSGVKEEIWELIDAYVVPGRELKARYAFEDLWEALHGNS